MVQCKKCKLFVSVTKDDVRKCKGPCEGVFHKKCIQNMKDFLRNEVCDICSRHEGNPKTTPPKITIDLQKATVETMLAELNNKLAIIYETQKKIDDLTDTVDFYAEQFQKLTEFKDSMQKKITALENTNTFLKKSNEALEERITLLEQKQVENNIEIAGVEEVKNENTLQIVQNIADKLKLNPDTIVETKRVGREIAGEKRARPIVVALCTKAARENWIRQRKVIVNNNDILNNKNEKQEIAVLVKQIPDSQDIIFIGDTNINILNSNTSVEKYKDELCAMGMQCLINECTREEIVSGRLVTSCIDHVWVRSRRSVEAHMLTCKLSDHYMGK
ncbi:hypothetical protein HW555_010733 [Spodoptera exigua]|uniref:FP protein N-terminal domain-containing protein n=1 Tax=Spodoptera exigua TaxID=7107 RepID=A0A835GAM8_SPOEX|nr:hypothetical protein HW555_010733 [Spodoptera exigua]